MTRLGVWLAAGLALLGWGCGTRDHSIIQAGGTSSRLAAISAECSRSLGGDGFGRVEVRGRNLIANETGEIPVPCRLVLAPGAHLQLNNVTLRTRHLVIRDDTVAGANGVQFNNSQIIGQADHGLLVDLTDSKDTFEMHHSTVDYPRSVWVRVAGVRNGDSGGGRIQVTHSTIRSSGATTEGVQLVAGDTNGGTMRLNKLTIDAPAEAEKALLAQDCKSVNLVGAPPECGPLTDAELTAGGATS